MLTSFTIKNYRGFKELSMDPLARVNLLVGANNSGKSSVLEALELWATQGHTRTLHSALSGIMRRRGEYRRVAQNGETEGTVRHLFHNHRFAEAIILLGLSGKRPITITVTWLERAPNLVEHSGPVLHSFTNGDVAHSDKSVLEVPAIDNERISLSWPTTSRDAELFPLRFVSTNTLLGSECADLLGSVALTEDEDRVIEALQTIEPTIERIGLAGADYRADRGSIVVRLRGQKQRVPIGSMGDGMWRMLNLALVLVETRGGFLLVDEIDTGLHYSVMNDMWKLVCKTAQELDVQVFATTHSRDCYESLAEVVAGEQTGGSTVAIHRIERDRDHSVVIDEEQLAIIAERAIEV
ncbi:MAG: AAA family ATPase, partial [Myxococcota bacterium]